MGDPEVERRGADALLAELDAWIDRRWDPDQTVEEWWRRLADGGWSVPTLPVDRSGRGLDGDEAAACFARMAERGVLAPPSAGNEAATLLVVPTLLAHGTDDQLRRHLPGITTGQRAWCQLFSEPGAGSDLASVRTIARRDGDRWLVTGQKVWTSDGPIADMGLLLARTSTEGPRQAGLTYFLLDLHQPGVEVRPLREMTGRAIFSEVFLTDAEVPANEVVGEVGGGWTVARTTLSAERSGLGHGRAADLVTGAVPGQRAGHLRRRAGAMVKGMAPEPSGALLLQRAADAYTEQARAAGATGALRQDVVRLHSLATVATWLAARAEATDVPGAANIGKLLASDLARRAADVGSALVGAAAMVHEYPDDDGHRSPTTPDDVTEAVVFSPAPAIYGGTDQIQRNILAERVLGLPREP